MKKLKVVLTGAAAFAMMMPMAMEGVSAADTKDGNTDVVYDNSKVIPDPDHPEDATWGISVPSSITFTDKNKVIDATVKLVGMNGATGAAAQVTSPTSVTVASKIDYILALSMDGKPTMADPANPTDDEKAALAAWTKENDAIAYSLMYDTSTTAGAADSPRYEASSAYTNTVLDLDAGDKPGDPKTSNPGSAILKGTATKTGAHMDLLTYTVAVTTTP